MKTKNIIILTTIFIASLIAFFKFIGIYTEWIWFESVDYLEVYKTILFSKIGIGIASSIFFIVFTAINIYLAERITKSNNKEYFKVVFGMVFFIGLLYGAIASSAYKTLLFYLNKTPFNITDPLFGLDIGFYVFKLPFYHLILNIFYSTIIINLIVLLLIYAIGLSISEIPVFGTVYKIENRIVPQVPKGVFAHFSVLIGILFILISISTYFAKYGLLNSEKGIVFGAGYTDIHARLPLLSILMVVFIILAILAFIYAIINTRQREIKLQTLIPKIAIFLLGISILVYIIYPAIIQAYVVEPNEIVKESPYIANNINYTLHGYGLDKVREKEYPLEYNLTAEDLSNNSMTVNNIRLWDWRPLMKTYGQLQEIRLYYTFKDIDVDRYNLQGKTQQVMISARELSQNQLQPRAKTWLNEHLVYTHGYGVVANTVTEVTKEGLPQFIIKDLPPKSSVGISIDRPEIYYGEVDDVGYVVVNTKQKEFDYPMGDTNQYTMYAGTGGIKLSTINKIAMVIKYGTLKFLLSGDITPNSKIMFYRSIRERVENIAPFLQYDNDPYIVIANGKLYYIQDAYTTDSKYPYSEPFTPLTLHPFKPLNYIRNSVKVVIDAYNGNVDFYVFDPEDPLVQTYSKIFPNLFKSIDKMPRDLQKHIRYPQGLFEIQAQLYSVYHMEDPLVFYNKEDAWNIPKEIYETSAIIMEPYYVILEIDGKEEFMLMIPFTPNKKANMIAWFAANPDGDLIIYKFSKQELVYGPMQIEARIDQDAEISEQLTLWSQKGSSIIRGNLLVIPIANSILYVEPLYIKAEKGELPELKRVLAAYNGKVTMQLTLEDALKDLFAITPLKEKEIISENKTLKQLSQQALQHYSNAQKYLKEGNWSGYGYELDMLSETLKVLVNVSEESHLA